MQTDNKAEVLRRLNFIEGHLDGVHKMIEEDRYCVDVLKQTVAVRRAIEKVESLLFEGHLKTCVVEGIQEGRQDQVTGELAELFKIRSS